MMAPDLYQNMPLYLGGGGGYFLIKICTLSPNMHLTRASTRLPYPSFLIYIVRTYMSSHTIVMAAPQESDVMPMYTFGY